VAARANLVNAKGLSLPKRAIYRGILKNRRMMANLLGMAAWVPGVSTKGGKPLRHMADFYLAFHKGIGAAQINTAFPVLPG